MAHLVDSVADFKAAVIKMGLGDQYDAMVAKGWDTFANYAFASAHTPGNADETVFIKDVFVPILGTEERLRPALRRLYFTAHTYVTADMKAQVEKTGDDAPRKMSVEEREARRARVTPELKGLDA